MSQTADALIAEGRLLHDLYHRLGIVQLDVPSLRDRREDIPVLIASFIATLSEQYNMKPRSIESEAMAILQAHNWRGNVRQLRNCIEQMMLSAKDHDRASLNLDDLPSDFLSDKNHSVVSPASSRVVALPLREAREMFEREYLLMQIERFGGNISKTANFVGMERSALHRKLKSLDVHTIEKTSDKERGKRVKGRMVGQEASSALDLISDPTIEGIDA